MFSKAELQFLELYRAAVWKTDIDEALFQETADWSTIKRLMKIQTVEGIVAQSVSRLPAAMRPEHNTYFNMIVQAARIEEENKHMNRCLNELFAACRAHRISAYLLKGQGVGLRYPEPLLRHSGDIDLFFLTPRDYEKALKELHKTLSVPLLDVDKKRKHAYFLYKGIPVELHGAIYGAVNRQCLRRTMPWTRKCFALYRAITWQHEGENIILPPAHFDALFIFLHLARHYFGSAVGLRQLTDWMRYLYVQWGELNVKKLKEDIEHLGLKKVWSVFGTMAVNHLGFPKDKMPFYREDYSKAAARVLRFILDSGNFGYHDKRIQTSSQNLFVRRAIALKGHLVMQLRNFATFPKESLYGIPELFTDGLTRFWRAVVAKLKHRQ